MQFKIGIMSVLSLSLLTACGGGGSSNDDTSNSTSSASSSVNNTNYAAVSGMYDASSTSNNIEDEHYLYIAADGKISAYNYRGDSKDLGGNCYTLAIGEETNAGLNGKTLTYSAANSKFSVNTGKSTIDWIVTGDSVTQIQLGGSISGKKISISANGEKLVIDSVKISSPTITDITAAICQL